MLDERFREGFISGIDRRQVRTERHAGGAGQSRHVDDKVRILLVGQSQGIGEDQPPFRVGIADLDCQTLAGGQNVPWSECIAGN